MSSRIVIRRSPAVPALPALWLCVLIAAPAVSRAQAADAGSWRIVHGDVRVVCPMTIGGSFEARTSAIEGTVTLAGPGAALGGEIAVDLTTLDTGIGLRNEHLRNTYLEVGRGRGFDHAVLSQIRLSGVDPHGFEGKTPFSGTFAVHGMQQNIAGQATIRREGRTVHVEASFPVTVSRFGIAKPQYLGVGVRDEVHVSVSLAAEPSDHVEAGR